MVLTKLIAVSVILMVTCSSLALSCVDYGSGESRLCVYVETTRQNVVGVDFTCSDFDGVENITVEYLGSPLYEHCTEGQKIAMMNVPSAKLQQFMYKFNEGESVFKQVEELPARLQAALGFIQVVTCTGDTLVVCVDIVISGESAFFCNTDDDVSRIAVRIGDEDQIDCQS